MAVPPFGTEYAQPGSKKRSRIYNMCAVMAPLAGKPQKMHIVSIKFRRNGSVTSWSTVLWRESNVERQIGEDVGVAQNER